MCDTDQACKTCAASSELERLELEVRSEASALPGAMGLAACQALAGAGLPVSCHPTPADLAAMEEGRQLAARSPMTAPVAAAQRGEIGRPTAGKSETPASSITADQAAALIAAGEGARVVFVPRAGGPITKASDSYEHHQATRRLARVVPETRHRLKASAWGALGVTAKATRPPTPALDRAVAAARVKAHHLAERERQESERRLSEHQAYLALKHADEAAAADVRAGLAEPVQISARNGRPIKGQAQLQAEAQERARVVAEADCIQAEKASDLARLDTIAQRHRKAPSVLGMKPGQVEL
jgi:hypothetical protein